MKCQFCERELLPHERPQRGLPPLCDQCARANQSWPVRPTAKEQPAAEEVGV